MDKTKVSSPKYKEVRTGEVISANQTAELMVKDDRSSAPASRRVGNIFIGTVNLFMDPLKRRHRKYYQNSRFHLFADAVLAIVVLALAGATVWAIFRTQPQNIGLTVKVAAEKMTGGQGAMFEITYANNEAVEISGAKLAVRLPQNFILKSVSPENLFNASGNSFDLGNLPSGANGTVALSGVLQGSVGDRQDMIANLTYRIESRKENFMARADYEIEDSSLLLALDAPASAFGQTEFRATARLVNNGLIDLANLKLMVEENWLISRADLRPEDNQVDLAGLPAGKEIVIDLLLLGRAEGEQSLVISAMTSKGKARQKLAEARRVISLRTAKLALKLTAAALNDCADEEAFGLKLTNNENADLKNLKLIFSSGNKNLRLDSVAATGGPGVKQTATDQFSVANLSAGGSLDLSLLTRFSRIKPAAAQSAWLTASAVYEMNGERMEQLARSEGFKVASETAFSSAGYYYSPQGDQLGIGPVPPTVDIPTTYWIFWALDNQGNDLKDVSVSADLPDNAYLTGNKSLLAGSLYNGPQSKRVVWSLDSAQKEGGDNRAKFEIGVVPGPGDIGKILTLLKNIEYKATDSFCGKTIEGKLKDINTSLESDRLIKGRGKVVD